MQTQCMEYSSPADAIKVGHELSVCTEPTKFFWSLQRCLRSTHIACVMNISHLVQKTSLEKWIGTLFTGHFEVHNTVYVYSKIRMINFSNYS